MGLVFACASLCMGLFACGTKQEDTPSSAAATEPVTEILVEISTPAWTEKVTTATAESSSEIERTANASTEAAESAEPTSESESAEAETEPLTNEPVISPEPSTNEPIIPTEPPTDPPVVSPEPSTEPPVIPTETPTEAPTEVPTEPSTEAPKKATVWYTTSALNLREAPSMDAGVILTIPKNTAVECLEEGPEWHLVTYGGATGYVACGYLADEALITFPGYGESAYAFMRYINGHFSMRLNGEGYTTKKKDACGAWIERTMNSLGYTATYYTGAAPSTGAAVKSYAFRKSCGVADAPLVVIGAHYDSRESRGAEDNGTGVGMVLELAQRYAQIDLPYDIDFCFWDGEELQGCAGSYFYVKQTPDLGRIALYITLDCLGAGDHMFAYGGAYENGKLVRAEAYTKAMEIATRFGIPLRPIPAGLAEPELQTPTRLYGSDQDYFARAGIPYLYFEANAWIDRNGAEQYPAGQRPYQYNSVHAAFADTFGTINHTKYDDLDVLERIVPGRIQAHMSCFAKILYTFLEEYQ